MPLVVPNPVSTFLGQLQNALAGAQGALSFSEWKLATDQPASTFKVALNALVKAGYVRKTPDSSYEITEAGRAAANMLTGI